MIAQQCHLIDHVYDPIVISAVTSNYCVLLFFFFFNGNFPLLFQIENKQPQKNYF